MRLVSEASFFSAAFIASYVYGEGLLRRLAATKGGTLAVQLATTLAKRFKNR